MQNAFAFNRDRAGPMALVALIHLLIAYALISGLALRVIEPETQELKTFDVAVPEPPAPEPPAPAESPAESELVAPQVAVPTSNPLPAAAPMGNSNATPSGAVASGAIWRSGAFSNETDYPAAARRRGEQGSLRVQFTVGADGRVAGCSVLASSGSSALDSSTCRIIERRFRYRPARDSQGNPVAETKTQTVTWQLEG